MIPHDTTQFWGIRGYPIWRPKCQTDGRFRSIVSTVALVAFSPPFPADLFATASNKVLLVDPSPFLWVTSQFSWSTQSNPNFFERFLSVYDGFFPYFPIFSACFLSPNPPVTHGPCPLQDCNLSGEEMQRLARWALEESRRCLWSTSLASLELTNSLPWKITMLNGKSDYFYNPTNSHNDWFHLPSGYLT